MPTLTIRISNVPTYSAVQYQNVYDNTLNAVVQESPSQFSQVITIAEGMPTIFAYRWVVAENFTPILTYDTSNGDQQLQADYSNYSSTSSDPALTLTVDNGQIATLKCNLGHKLRQ